jgi:hypothetical protein
MNNSNIKTRISEASQQATRMPRCRKPSPKEFISNFYTLQLLEGEVLSNSFLKEENINERVSKKVSELVSVPSVSESPNVPNERSHLKQLEKLVLGEQVFSLRFWEPEHNQQ